MKPAFRLLLLFGLISDNKPSLPFPGLSLNNELWIEGGGREKMVQLSYPA